MFEGNSFYNAFQLKVQKRFNSGQTILLAYTGQKFLTDSEGFAGGNGSGGIQNWLNMKGERALSSYDASHRLVVSYVLDLPTGHGKKFLGGASGLTNKLVSGWAMEGVTTRPERVSPFILGMLLTQPSLMVAGRDPTTTPSARDAPRTRP